MGAAISEDLKESSFHDNLDGELIKALVAFHNLPYEQYKQKVEHTHQEMRERKLGLYALRKASSDTPTKANISTKTASKGNAKTTFEAKEC